MSDGEVIDRKALRDVVERAEQLEERKAELAEESKALFAEAKEKGLDPAHVRRALKERAKGLEVVELENEAVQAIHEALE